MKRYGIFVFFSMLFVSSWAMAQVPAGYYPVNGEFIYPVCDGTKPANTLLDPDPWDDLSINEAGNAGDYGCYDIQPFGPNGHTGLDLNGNVSDDGWPIVSISDGVVYKSWYNSAWGNCVCIDHPLPNGATVASRYAHLSARYVEDGNRVVRGQIIGAMGNTGSSSAGTHLHFGMYATCAEGIEYDHGYMNPVDEEKVFDPYPFLEAHRAHRFSDYDDVKVCLDEPHGDASTNWYIDCQQERTVFHPGQTVWTLLRLHDVKVDHRFRVKAYREGVFQWEYTTLPSNVTNLANGWQYAHFWPSLSNGDIGEWEFYYYFLNRDDTSSNGTYITRVSFTVADYYTYDWNAYVCAGPVIETGAPNWNYFCEDQRNVYDAGETVYGVIRIDNPMVDHQFKVVASRDGVPVSEWTTDWNNVGDWGWVKAYFVTQIPNATAGAWRFDFYVNRNRDHDDFEYLDHETFTVLPSDAPYEYYGDVFTCKGPIIPGNESNNWIYGCENPVGHFNTGDTAIALIRIDNVQADHRWKVQVFVDGYFQWAYQTDWSDVGFWGWEKTYFWPTTVGVWPGNWEYRIFLDTGTYEGFKQIETVTFPVYP
jgi:hypothetical protein